MAPSPPARADAPGERPRLHCHWQVQAPLQATGPVMLRVALANRGSLPVQVLEWGTPFEGWMSPWVQVSFEGQPLPYQGATVKRGDPGREEYMRLAPGRQRQATVDLAEAFDLSRPGRYELRPALRLHDAYTGASPAPRPRAQHEALVLDCPPLSFIRPG